MREFASNARHPRVQERLPDALSRSGLSRRFKDAVQAAGLLEELRACRDEAW
ncbi:MAG: hypothetical protein LBO20_08875 [Bifidobacteriaceae bacterium]|nr:hypothetical protein [Bifidobacteriaceae bacterium]